MIPEILVIQESTSMVDIKKTKKKLLSILLEDWSARDHSGNEGNE